MIPFVGSNGSASYYPPLHKKSRTKDSVTLHRQIVAEGNTCEDVLKIAAENSPLDVDNLATAMHKIAKLRKFEGKSREELMGDPRWRALVKQVVDGAIAFVWPMRLLSLVAWAVASIEGKEEPALMQICGIMTRKVKVGPSVPQDLTMAAWALATARVRDGALLGAVATQSLRQVEEFVPQDLAMTAWAYAKLVAKDGGTRELMDALAGEAVKKATELNGQNFSNLTWSLATLKQSHAPLFDTVAAVTAGEVAGLGPQEFSNIVWSFATIQHYSDRLFRRVAPRVVVCVKDLDSQHLANITWAYAKVGHRDDALFQCLGREAMKGSREMHPLNLSNLAWAFASAGWQGASAAAGGSAGTMTTKRMGLRDLPFFKWLAQQACLKVQDFSSQNCANLVWAFATMRIRDDRMLEAIAAHAIPKLGIYDAQHLANMLWAYAKLGMYHEALFYAAADEMVFRGLPSLCAVPQNLSNALWAFGVFAAKHAEFFREIRIHVPHVYYERIVASGLPLNKSSKAQIAMSVLSLHRLGLDDVAWALFDRIKADKVLIGGEAYSAYLAICGDNRDVVREVDVWWTMAETAFTNGLKAGMWNVVLIKTLGIGDLQKFQLALRTIEAQDLGNNLSDLLADRANLPLAKRNANGVEWRRRTREEHEWVTLPSGVSLRLNKIEYYKEIGVLSYIIGQGLCDNPDSVGESIESFMREQELWLKLAADEKAAVLDAVVEMNRPSLIVEVGCYVGFSSTRMASRVRKWAGKIVTIEVDPYHAGISRNTHVWAGVQDTVEIWCGHSENLIPRLRDNFNEGSVDMLFLDQRGTTMLDDLKKVESLKLLSPQAVVIADNVLRPGAPQFMWWTCVAGPYETQAVSLKEYGQDVVEDWMSVSYHVPHLPRSLAPPPDSLMQLAHETDAIRWQSVDQRVTEKQWDEHAQMVRKAFFSSGIRPPEVKPFRDARGVAQIDLRQRGEVPGPPAG